MRHSRTIRDIASVEEIYLYLTDQANLRATENDEAGILKDLADQWIKRLVDLDPHIYGGLNYEG